MKTITVKEFLEATKDKRYKAVESDMHGIYSIINGKDIPSSYDMELIGIIVSHKMGNYTLSYGRGSQKLH